MADQVVKPPNMNYANMIEEKNLKKGFIVATLISTIVGTFTASMTLHDKIQERRDKKKQQATDNGQDKEIKELRAKLETLTSKNKADGGKADSGEKLGDDKKSTAENDEKPQAGEKKNGVEADGKKSQAGDGEKSQAGEGKKSQAGDGKKSQAGDDKKTQASGGDKSRIGDDGKSQRPRSRASSTSSKRRRRRRDSVDADQDFAQVASRSKNVIEQTFADNVQKMGPQYAEGDLITINALQSQILEQQKVVIDILQRAVDEGRDLTEDDKRRLMEAQNQATSGSLDALQGQYNRMAAEKNMPPTQMSVPPRAKSRAGLSQREAPTNKPWESDPLPPPTEARRRQSKYGRDAAMAGGLAAAAGAGAFAAARERDRRTEAPTRAASDDGAPRRRPQPEERSRASLRPGQQPLPPEGGDRKSVRPREYSPPTFGDLDRSTKPRNRPQRDFDEWPSSWRPKPENVRSRKALSDERTSRGRAPPTERRKSSMRFTDQEIDDRPPRPTSFAPKTQAPTTKTATIALAKTANGPARDTAAKQQEAPKSKMKALPAPEAPLFCRYAQDLQRNEMPLHKSFRPGASQCCPSCNLTIPVDTRDIWVFSTHIPPKQKNDKPKTRDYRMDARFVVKCHDGQGKFACVLCDRSRDLDCICKNVESLVKHMGQAHDFEEFDRDPDLVKMKPGSVLSLKNGKELVLA